jgi:hypothetical protein
MKKLYFQPACTVVELGTMQMMAQSLRVNSEPDAPVIDNPNDILSKGMNDIDLWDDEW